MKLIRKRKPNIKTMLGVTKVKRKISKATGIPITKSGRKRKLKNLLTNGAYGKYERARATINRPYKSITHPPSCIGCLVWALSPCILLIFVFILLVLQESSQILVKLSYNSRGPRDQLRRGPFHSIIFKYLYTVGLLSPHTRASSLTFICPLISDG